MASNNTNTPPSFRNNNNNNNMQGQGPPSAMTNPSSISNHSQPGMQQQQYYSQQPLSASTPYQVTQAQLSPPSSKTSGPPPPRLQQQQQPSVSVSSSSETTTTPAASQLAGKVQHLFWKSNNKDANNNNEPNYGFTVTEKLVQQHAQTLQQQQQSLSVSSSSSHRPLFQFQVTKLRTWRTGYTRILVLYKDSLATLDPETCLETNRWYYQSVSDWMAVPKEEHSILLQVVPNDKLKFSIHNASRSFVLTCLLQLQDVSAQLPASETTIYTMQRLTRAGLRKTMELHVKPYGFVEVSLLTKQTIQVYRFVDILSCSLLAETGIVLTFKQPHKSRLFFLDHATARSQIMTRMSENMTLLGLQLQLQESMTLQEWLTIRQNVPIGPVATTWQVQKTTPRHDARVVGEVDGWVGGIVTRELVVTGLGYLVERDGVGVVGVRKLSDLYALIRHPQTNDMTLEYADGSHRTYTSRDRDALLVSILDAAATLGKNTAVHVTDVTTSRYCLSSLATSSPQDSTAGAGLFQPISIPSYCLKKVHALSTQAFAYVSSGIGPFDWSEQLYSTVEACREFNASVLPSGEGLPDTTNTDKTIMATCGALWGLIGKLLLSSANINEAINHDLRETSQSEVTATTFFQTLYRMSQTPTGYKGSVDLTTLQETIVMIWQINDSFCKFWAIQVLNILLSGRPNRELEAEYVNKCVVFKVGGQVFIDGIVAALVNPSIGGRQVSDLVVMAASDILQSILCTFHDTTSPDHFTACITALANKHVSLLNSLRSRTPFVIENTVLLLHLLSTHAPSTAAAIRDAALSTSLLLQHFYAAIFSPMEGQRFLSRYLCSLWLSGPLDCDEKRLLKRMVPIGFLAYLNMPMLSPMEEEQLDDLEHDVTEENIRDAAGRSSVEYVDASTTSAVAHGGAGTNTGRLRRRVAIAAASGKQSNPSFRQENFRVFFHILTQGTRSLVLA